MSHFKIACLAALVLAACSDSQDPDDGGGGGTTSSGIVAPPSASSSGPPVLLECDGYLECVLETAPESYGAMLEVYGPNSDCRTSTAETAAACEQACRDAKAHAQDAFPDAMSCAACQSNDDCPDGALGLCHPELRICVACVTSSDCSSGSACDGTSKQCVIGNCGSNVECQPEQLCMCHQCSGPFDALGAQCRGMHTCIFGPCAEECVYINANGDPEVVLSLACTACFDAECAEEQKGCEPLLCGM